MFFKVFQIFGTQNPTLLLSSYFINRKPLYISVDLLPCLLMVYVLSPIDYILVYSSIIVNESSFEDWRSSMDKFFEGNFNETWNTTLNQFDALVGNISLYISCFEFNKFMAMPDEYEMEKLGIQLVDRKQLWAGIGNRKIIIMP